MRRHRLSTALILAPLLAGADISFAANLCVNPGGTGGCSASIQAAVDVARSGDTVQVAAGSYVESVWIRPRKGTITLSGAGPGATIISPPNVESHVLTVSASGTRATISGVTLTGGSIGAKIWEPGPATFVDVEFRGNAVGLETRGKATLLRCTAADNDEYGLRVTFKGAFLTITDSTVSGNGQMGVVIDPDTKAKIVRSTISGNGGYGVFEGPATIASSTVTGNLIGGIEVYRRTTLRSSIVCGNGTLGGDCVTQDFAQLRVLETSLIGAPGSCTVVAAAGKLLTGDPLLGPLQNNGGTTETHALLPGSPAIGVLTKKPLCKVPDQRGVARAAPCDLGAYEAP